MSDDLTKLAEEVLRLDGEATAPPWHIERDLENDTTTLLGGEPWRAVAQMPFYAPHRIEANEDAITTYRTAAPTLARAVLDARKRIDELTLALRWALGEGPDPGAWPEGVKMPVTEADEGLTRDVLRAATDKDAEVSCIGRMHGMTAEVRMSAGRHLVREVRRHHAARRILAGLEGA